MPRYLNSGSGIGLGLSRVFGWKEKGQSPPRVETDFPASTDGLGRAFFPTAPPSP